jgi:hypothetical protein
MKEIEEKQREKHFTSSSIGRIKIVEMFIPSQNN